MPTQTRAQMERSEEDRRKREAERRWKYRERVKAQPNVVYLREIAYAFLLVAVISAGTMYGSYWLYERLLPAISRQPGWLSVLELSSAAIFVGWVAWNLRDSQRHD
jgi:hypothetical protein